MSKNKKWFTDIDYLRAQNPQNIRQLLPDLNINKPRSLDAAITTHGVWRKNFMDAEETPQAFSGNRTALVRKKEKAGNVWEQADQKARAGRFYSLYGRPEMENNTQGLKVLNAADRAQRDFKAAKQEFQAHHIASYGLRCFVENNPSLFLPDATHAQARDSVVLLLKNLRAG